MINLKDRYTRSSIDKVVKDMVKMLNGEMDISKTNESVKKLRFTAGYSRTLRSEKDCLEAFSRSSKESEDIVGMLLHRAQRTIERAA